MIAINPIQETWTDHQQTIMEKTARLLKNLGIISNTDHVSNLYGIKKSYGSFAGSKNTGSLPHLKEILSQN